MPHTGLFFSRGNKTEQFQQQIASVPTHAHSSTSNRSTCIQCCNTLYFYL